MQKVGYWIIIPLLINACHRQFKPSEILEPSKISCSIHGVDQAPSGALKVVYFEEEEKQLPILFKIKDFDRILESGYNTNCSTLSEVVLNRAEEKTYYFKTDQLGVASNAPIKFCIEAVGGQVNKIACRTVYRYALDHEAEGAFFTILP